jgi:hypothetical protein
MATSMANPQAAAPPPQQGAEGGGGTSAQQDSGSLTTILARIGQFIDQLGKSNVTIQPEMMVASRAFQAAMRKVGSAQPGPPSPLSAPPQG